LSPSRVFTSTMGTFPDDMSKTPGTNDKTFAFDPATGDVTPAGLEAGAFSLGRGAVLGGKLFMPDATFDNALVHVLDVSGTVATKEDSSFDPGPAKHMPPREIASY